MKLYEIADEFQAVWSNIEEACDSGDGTIPPDMKWQLSCIERALESKAENICVIIKRLEYAADACKREEQRLAAQRKAAEKNVEWLKAYLKENMEATGHDKLAAGVFKLRIQQNGQAALVIPDDKAIPDDYWMQPPKVIDREAVRNALTEGIPVDGAELVKGTHLRIS